MNSGIALQAQFAALSRELSRARAAISGLKVQAALRDRVSARFDTELTRLQKRIETLQAAAARNGQPAAASWRDLRVLQADAARLFEEVLAFVQGALVREQNLDDGICALTDALLDDLAAASDVPWGRFTLLATSEFFRDAAEIIRIRFPDPSLWNMPFAAHEFGHFVGPQLCTKKDGEFSYPFQERLKAADQSRGSLRHAMEWDHEQESFADLYATYTLGPAYAAAFILLRMNAGDAHVEAATHPTAAKRVHAIFWTLERMSVSATGLRRQPFREVTSLLHEAWQASMAAAGHVKALDAAGVARVEQRSGELYELLTSCTPQGLLFGQDAWLRTESMLPALRVELGAVEPEADALPAGATRREVLNAAWLARLGADDASPLVTNVIGHRALSMYRRVATRGN
jgi:hypothetical protein